MEAVMAAVKHCGRPALTILFALALFGCGDLLDPVEPSLGHKGDRPYYPLAVGNHWVYSGRYSVTVDSLGSRSTRAYQRTLELEVQADGVRSVGQTWAREASRVG